MIVTAAYVADFKQSNAIRIVIRFAKRYLNIAMYIYKKKYASKFKNKPKRVPESKKYLNMLKYAI